MPPIFAACASAFLNGSIHSHRATVGFRSLVRVRPSVWWGISIQVALRGHTSADVFEQTTPTITSSECISLSVVSTATGREYALYPFLSGTSIQMIRPWHSASTIHYHGFSSCTSAMSSGGVHACAHKRSRAFEGLECCN